MEPTAIARKYHEFLSEEGYRPKIDDQGDVIFKIEGKFYFIQTYEHDELYFRICYPNFLRLESGADIQKALNSANIANQKIKASRLTLFDNFGTADVGILLAHPDDFKHVFNRGISAIDAIVKCFLEYYRSDTNTAAEDPNGSSSKS